MGARGGSLGLEEKLLVEGFVFVAPLVPAAPAGVAPVSAATPAGFKGEVQQVVQADFLRSSKLSRAKLGPACLRYLQNTHLVRPCAAERTFPKAPRPNVTSSRRPPPATPYCRPPLWGGLLSKFLLFCEPARRGPGKVSLLGKEGSRLRL